MMTYIVETLEVNGDWSIAKDDEGFNFEFMWLSNAVSFAKIFSYYVSRIKNSNNF